MKLPNPTSLFYRALPAIWHGENVQELNALATGKAQLLQLVNAIKASGIISKPLRRAVKNARRALRVGKSSERVVSATYRLALAFNTTVKALVANEVSA